MNPFSRHLVLPLVTMLFVMQPLVGSSQTTSASTALTRYVDPFIGTGFHGHVFMGANVQIGRAHV